MDFPQNLVTQISIPNNVPFAPGFDVIGLGTGIPQAMIDAGYSAAIVFYSSGWNPAGTGAQIKYQFIADKAGIIYFGYALVDNASVSQAETIVVYEAHGFGQTSSQTTAQYNSTNFLDSPAGQIRTLQTADSLIYKGAELSDLINKGMLLQGNDPWGLVAFATFTPTAGQPTATTETVIGYLDFVARTNRFYKVRTGILSHSTVGQTAEFKIRTTGDGSTPTITSGLLSTSYRIPTLQPGFCDELISIGAVATDRKIRMVLTMTSTTGTSVAFSYSGQVRWFVEDMGRLMAQTGVTTPAAPDNYKTFDIQPLHSVCYAAPDSTKYPPSSAIGSFNDVKMLQGDVHDGGGNYRSWTQFDRTVTGGGSGGTLTDMVGATKVDYLQLFLYYEWWYYVDPFGGPVPGHQLQVCTLGWHNVTGLLPATETVGGFPNLYNVYWSGRNVGLWIDLTGTSIQTAITNGTFRGFVIGNGGGTNYEYYGYATGANGVGGRQPGLKAGYYK